MIYLISAAIIFVLAHWTYDHWALGHARAKVSFYETQLACAYAAIEDISETSQTEGYQVIYKLAENALAKAGVTY